MQLPEDKVQWWDDDACDDGLGGMGEIEKGGDGETKISDDLHCDDVLSSYKWNWQRPCH